MAYTLKKNARDVMTWLLAPNVSIIQGYMVDQQKWVDLDVPTIMSWLEDEIKEMSFRALDLTGEVIGTTGERHLQKPKF